MQGHWCFTLHTVQCNRVTCNYTVTHDPNRRKKSFRHFGYSVPVWVKLYGTEVFNAESWDLHNTNGRKLQSVTSSTHPVTKLTQTFRDFHRKIQQWLAASCVFLSPRQLLSSLLHNIYNRIYCASRLPLEKEGSILIDPPSVMIR